MSLASPSSLKIGGILSMENKMRYYSLMLIVVCIVVFIIQALSNSFTEAFVLTSSEVLMEPWTLVTSIFLHGSASHLLFNMFALFLFGLLLEKFVGSKKFLIIFFLTGVIASTAALFYTSSLGASGAIYGIIGALAALKPRMIVWTYGVPMPMVAAAGLYLLLDFAGMFFPSNIANTAHIAGLIAGVLIGLALREPHQKKKKISREKILTDEEINQWEDTWM